MKDKTVSIIEKLNEISLIITGDRTEALVAYLCTLDDIVGIHSIRVADYSVMAGRELELPEETIRNLYTSALLHDIGKLLVPSEILHKTDHLRDDELEAVRRHPLTGEVILRENHRFSQYADAVFYHHEFFNGRGYPTGLSGPAIPLFSKIIAVADAYEAMTSDRPYRKGFSHREAVIRLRAGKYTQFDPEITDVFLKALRRYSNTNLLNIETNL